MRFFSTRGAHETDFIGAVSQGLAPDGCLYVPEELPRFAPHGIGGDTLEDIGTQLLAPFAAGSPLEPDLRSLCEQAFDFPVPLVPVDKGRGPLWVLEVFHGPTAAFKDVGARFLAALMERALVMEKAPGKEPVVASERAAVEEPAAIIERAAVEEPVTAVARTEPSLPAEDTRPLTILVATSGDTGGAVAAAFHRRRGMRVGVLFPKGQVSPRQKHQLTCWSDNVRSFEVNGTFDDCQRLVKQAFTDPPLNSRHRLSAANSINLGRLLPQAVYHAAASLWHWRAERRPANFIVPTGNLGNALACIWARAMGMPIGDIILATNANRVLPEFLATGDWQPRPSIQTLASAMDVGNPSNMERLRHLLPDFAELRGSVEAYPVSDAAIRQQIAVDHERLERVWCPHTATGFNVYDQLPLSRCKEDSWIVVATAHPAKFDNIVEPAAGTSVSVPPALAALLELPSRYESIDPNLATFSERLNDW